MYVIANSGREQYAERIKYQFVSNRINYVGVKQNRYPHECIDTCRLQTDLNSVDFESRYRFVGYSNYSFAILAVVGKGSAFCVITYLENSRKKFFWRVIVISCLLYGALLYVARSISSRDYQKKNIWFWMMVSTRLETKIKCDRFDNVLCNIW